MDSFIDMLVISRHWVELDSREKLGKKFALHRNLVDTLHVKNPTSIIYTQMIREKANALLLDID
jgi:hypothetical protein